MVRKEAVDAVTKAYYAKYFGPYGKQWTEAIPRRVAMALAADLAKTAAKEEPVTTGAIAPLGWAKTKTGGLLFEGFFRGTAKTGAQIFRAFAAEFAPDGALLTLKAREA